MPLDLSKKTSLIRSFCARRKRRMGAEWSASWRQDGRSTSRSGFPSRETLALQRTAQRIISTTIISSGFNGLKTMFKTREETRRRVVGGNTVPAEPCDAMIESCQDLFEMMKK